jgi:hypothetical protein
MASNNLVIQAREVHAQWLALKKANRDGRRERAAEEEAARTAPRYEAESFDVSVGTAPEAILQRTLPMPDVIRCARELVDTHVFGEVRGWMAAVARELEVGDGAAFILNLFWWQMVLDHLQLRSQRILDATKREAALPPWQRTKSAAQLAAFNDSVPLSEVCTSNCIDDTGLQIDLDSGEAAEGGAGDGSGSETSRIIAHRLRERARRLQVLNPPTSPFASGAEAADADVPLEASASAGVDPADSDMPAEQRGSPSPLFATAAETRSPSPASSLLKGGLPGLFRRLCSGYRSLFLSVTQVAAHASNHRRSSSAASDHLPPAVSTAATVLELSANSTLRDRACSYFRALVIEAVVLLFHSAYAGSVSLTEGSLLHFPVLRERVVSRIS